MAIKSFLLPMLTFLSLMSFVQLYAADDMKTIAKGQLSDFHWSAEEAKWIKDHVGIIFYDDGELPRFTMDEQIDMIHSLGTKKVKTWLKGQYADEMRSKLDSAVYKRTFAEFDTVLLDVCPLFIFDGEYDDAKSTLIQNEYKSIAYHLASKYRKYNKTFLLSIYMETNFYFGTERSYNPDFPPVKFFNDAAAGIRDGISKAQSESDINKAKVYSVIEIANLPTDFIKNFLPHTSADLYAISYYAKGELGAEDITLDDVIKAVSESVPHNGPFGKDNLILGELGRSVFVGGNDGDDHEQIQYLQKALNTARQNKFQYAFIFWVNDQERSHDDGWGFVASKKAGGKYRRAWYAFQNVFKGKPQSSAKKRVQVGIDAVRPSKYNPKPGEIINIKIDLSNRSSWYTPAKSAKDIRVQLHAGYAAKVSRFSLEPDEFISLQTEIPAPDNSNITIIVNSPDSGGEIIHKVSLDRADLVVERVYTEPASPKPGDKVMMFAEVRNIGNAPITDFAVYFHVDDFKSLWAAWGCIYGDNKLKKDEMQVIGGGFPWIATTPGLHKLRAYVNPDGSRESNYNNNIAYGEFIVQDTE